jgi:hypothetical protein
MRHSSLALGFFFAANIISCLNMAEAQESAHITAVEESWELTIGEPNQLRNAPQMTLCMLPLGNSDGIYFMFTLNFKSAPDYSPGGMQVSVWHGEDLVHHHNGPQEGQLDVANDTISWTQRMSVDNGEANFEVVSGNSSSWGSFGGQGYLRTSGPTQLANLNSYSTYDSLDESGIGFAGNRVASLKLKKVKWEFSNGKTYTANAPFDIDGDLDPWTE